MTKFKSIFLISFFAAAGSIAALPTPRTLAYVCSRIQSPPIMTSCFQAGRDAYLDNYALGACDRIQNADITVDCVKAIANRSYTPDEVTICDNVTNAYATVACLSSAGRPSRDISREEIYREVLFALDSLRANRIYEAETALRNLAWRLQGTKKK